MGLQRAKGYSSSCIPGIVTALFLKETLASAANDADIAIEGQGREAKSFQRKLEDRPRALGSRNGQFLFSHHRKREPIHGGSK